METHKETVQAVQIDLEHSSKVEVSECLVCKAPSPRPFLQAGSKYYHRCDCCMATFMNPGQWLAPEMEYRQYQIHQNNENDTGYQKFLSKLTDPLLQKLNSGQNGLDYGCGPGPALAKILSEEGHSISLFDPFFYPDQQVLDSCYDFITCTEVVEHFHDPYAEFRRLDGLLRPGGWLAVMTLFQTDDARFADWHYRKDPTHVVFYRRATLRTLAADLAWSCRFPARNVALFRKGPA